MNRIVLLILFLLNLTLVSVNGQTTESYGGQLNIGVLLKQKLELNPFQISSPIQEEITQMVFGYGLTKKPDKVINPPDLIARYIFTENGRIWRMVLDRNINFHNGINLRNTDVKFTFDLIKKHKGFILNRKLDFKNIRSISGNGDLEVIFELIKPDKNFGQKLADIPIISKDYYGPALTLGYSIFNTKQPMGMGPFKVEFQTDRFLSLKYSPFYYAGRPFLDKIGVYFFSDEQAMIDAFVDGKIDYLELPDLVTARSIYELMGKNMFGFRIPRPEVKVYTMLFNLKRFPFSAPEVRKAIYFALNRKNIANRYLKEISRVANSLLFDSNQNYEKSLTSDPYNPQQALYILKKAGWQLKQPNKPLEKNGRPLSFKLYFTKNSDLESEVARAIKLNLAEVNINVNPVPIGTEPKRTIINGGNYQALVYDYTYDPQHLFEAFEDFYLEILGAGYQKPNYRNNYLSRLFKIAKERPEFRKNLYKRFQSFSEKELPNIYLFFDERIIIGINGRFRNFRVTFKEGDNFYYRMNPIENWFVPKEEQKF